METKKQSGFALLMTLIVVGVVLSIGLSVLDLSIKQIRLSTNTKDSEIAFHAANAGMECARFWHRTLGTEMENGELLTDVECFGADATEMNPLHTGLDPGEVEAEEIENTSDGVAYQYQYKVSWPTNDRCTIVNTLVANVFAFQNNLTITGMDSLFPGYPGGATKICEEGERCATIAVRGYNKPCNQVPSYGTVEREVLLEL